MDDRREADTIITAEKMHDFRVNDICERKNDGA